MKKGKNKRLSALILSSVLALNLIMPFSSYAQEIPAQTAAETQAVHENDTISLLQPETEVQKDSNTSHAETESKKEDNVSQTETNTLKDGSTSQTDAEVQKGVTSEQKNSETQNTQKETQEETETDTEPQETALSETKNNPQTGTDSDESEKAVPLAYDITKPVIESVELVQNGQTLKNGDTVELKVKAYDTESEIQSVTASFYGKQKDSYNIYLAHQMTLTCSDNSGVYTGTWTLENMTSSEIYISEIKVTDSAENYQTAEVSNGNDYLYLFNIQSEETLKITDLKFAANQKTLQETKLNNDEVLGLSLTIDQPLTQNERICISFKSDSYYVWKFVMAPDESGKNYSFSYSNGSSPNEDISVTYNLDKIYIEKANGEEELNTDAVGPLSFTVECKKEEPRPPVENQKPEITKVELNRNREILSPGDTSELVIHINTDKELAPKAYAAFAPAAGIAENFISVALTYDKANSCYTGTLEITEDTYPCEWYLSRLSLWEHDNDHAPNDFTYDFSNEDYPYYVNISNDGTFTSDTYTANIIFVTLDSSGHEVRKTITKEKAGRRTSLKELEISLPEISSPISGVSQTGWQYNTNKAFTEDTPILVRYNNESFTIYAVYDNLFVPVKFTYAGNNGQWLTDEQIFILEHGTTYGMLCEKISAFKPTNALSKYPISDWDWNYTFSDDDVIKADTGNLYVKAQYKDVVLLTLDKSYFNEDGYYMGLDANNDTSIFAVKKGTTYNEAIEQIKSQPAPVSYNGLRFSYWECNAFIGDKNKEVKNGDRISMSAVYENYIIRYMITVSSEPYETLTYCQIAEEGDTVTVLKQFDGIEGKVTWIDWPTEDDTFVVGDIPVNFPGNCYSFYGTVKKATSPEQPETPDTETPDTETPDTEIPDTTVDDVIEQINNAQDGASVAVSMNGTTVVSKDILEAAKGKDVNVSMNMGGYTWTINGMNILASGLKDINLEVKFDTNAIPSNVVKALAGDNPVRQLSLTHNGDFGFKATLTLNAGKENADKYGNLYYYDSDGKMVFINAGKIAADGSVSLDFSHASDYVLVMSDKLMSQSDVPESTVPVESDESENESDNESMNESDNESANESGSETNNESINGSNSQSNNGQNSNANGAHGQNPVKTGDSAPLALCAVLMIAAACVFVIALKKHRFGK